jgi:hypothetical protein
MQATTTKLEEVFRDTHKSPETFIKRFGERNAKNFVGIFGKRLCDGMELPISEAVDALDRVFDTYVKTSAYGSMARLVRKAPGGNPMTQENGEHLIGLILDAAKKFDDLNDLMGFFHGLGAVAQEFGYKDQSYFEYQSQYGSPILSFFGYIHDLVGLAKGWSSDEQCEVGPVYRELFGNSIKYSASIKSAYGHLEIVERDLS